MKTRITNAKIACLDINLQKARMQLGVQILVDDPELLRVLRERVRVVARGDGEVHFREDDELRAGELQRLDRFPEHDLGEPVRVHLCAQR